MEWISVKDRLPEIPLEKWESITVLCCWGLSEKNMATMSYTCDEVRGKLIKRFIYHGRISPFQVTHWMPLPEPPKEVLY